MNLLVRPEAARYDDVHVLGPPTETDAPTDRPRGWGRGRLVRGAVAVAVVLAVAWAVLPWTVRLGDDVEPGVPVDAGLFVPEYGERGTHALDYRHHELVTLRVPVRNRGPLPLRIDRAGLDVGAYPLLAGTGDNLPLSIGPWDEAVLELTFRFDNCRYYHERSADTWDRVLVGGSVLGRDFDGDVTLAHPLALHGQTINSCPDRTLRRDDDHPLGR